MTAQTEVKELLEALQKHEAMSAQYVDTMREIRNKTLNNDEFKAALKEALPEHNDPMKPNVLGRMVKEAEPAKKQVEGPMGPKWVQTNPKPDPIIDDLTSRHTHDVAVELDNLRDNPDYEPPAELADEVYEAAKSGALNEEQMKVSRYIQQMGGGKEDYQGSTNLGSGMTNAQGEPDLGEIQGTMNLTRVDAMVEATEEAQNAVTNIAYQQAKGLDPSKDGIVSAEEAAKLSQEEKNKFSSPFDMKPPSPYDND